MNNWNDTIKALRTELKTNEVEIKRLQNRNAQINRAFENLSVLSKKIKARKSHPKKGTANPNSMGERIMKILEDGIPASVTAIAMTLFDRNKPTRKEINAIANSCSGLLKKGRLIRLERGVYKTKFPVKTTEAETRANIGSDTRVVQVPKEASHS